jgi:acyl carrier protein
MTREEALAWIAEVFEEPRENINETTPRLEVPGWDSLGVLSLMAGLDEKFDVRLTETELNDLNSVEDILKVLERAGALS